MRMILFLCAYLNCIFARPQKSVEPDVIESSFNLTDSGGYSFSFSTSGGYHHEATGEIQNAGTPNEVLAVKGAYSYIASDGTVYEVRYTADEKGFLPVFKTAAPYDTRIGSDCIGSLCGTGLG